VAFCCNWCSYAGADLSGTNRLQYPANVKIIRIPCSCRLNPMFILRAFQKGADGVILGHSERRQYFAETNETVNKRTKAALAGGLKPIICVGESLDQREQGVTEELVRMQVKIALNGVTADELKNVVIAYEPIWAIGTGKTATADQAEEVCAAIRKVVGELYGEDAAKALTVQYGGSMNPKNAEELLSKPDVDGGLIGGASLKAPDFAVIVNAATKG
jgi:triosephosphate isomerase